MNLKTKQESKLTTTNDHYEEVTVSGQFWAHGRNLTFVLDKIKQIIERIKTNEGRYREKHQGHKTDNAHVQHELETNLEKITTTVDHLSQVLNGKITLLERQFKGSFFAKNLP